jgi:hypothetical protein
MTKNFFPAAFFALTLATSLTTPSSAKQVVTPVESHGLVGREMLHRLGAPSA